MILLTGATGTAGSFIANEFVRERLPVRILVRNRAKAARLRRTQGAPFGHIALDDFNSRDFFESS